MPWPKYKIRRAIILIFVIILLLIGLRYLLSKSYETPAAPGTDNLCRQDLWL